MGVGVRGGWTRSGDLVLGKLKSSPPGTGSWLEEFLGELLEVVLWCLKQPKFSSLWPSAMSS